MPDGGYLHGLEQTALVLRSNGLHHVVRNGTSKGVPHVGGTEDRLRFVLAERAYDRRWSWDPPTRGLSSTLHCPEEGSGTSGMMVLHGALHDSELDGWCDDAYQPDLE